jgi:hypothetical protein
MEESGLEKRIFMICPVRDATGEEQLFLQNYMIDLEAQGHKVHYPPRNTNQIDSSGGYNICFENCSAIVKSDEVHIYWTKKSHGSLFDFGMSFMLFHVTKSILKPKPLVVLINREDVENIVKEDKREKSFEHVLLQLDAMSRQYLDS